MGRLSSDGQYKIKKDSYDHHNAGGYSKPMYNWLGTALYLRMVFHSTYRNYLSVVNVNVPLQAYVEGSGVRT